MSQVVERDMTNYNLSIRKYINGSKKLEIVRNKRVNLSKSNIKKYIFVYEHN